MEYHYIKFVNLERWYLNALNMFVFDKALCFQKSWNPNKMLTFQTVQILEFLFTPFNLISHITLIQYLTAYTFMKLMRFY